jgi:hypothetical protein
MQQQGRQQPKHQIELLQQHCESLNLQLQALQEEQQVVKVQHAVAASCCEILHSMRSCSAHKGWGFVEGSLLPEELPLLLDLGFRVDICQLLAADLQQIVTKHQHHQQPQQESTRMTRSSAAAKAPPKIRLQQLIAGSSNSPVFCWDTVSGPSTAAAGQAQPFAGQQRPVLMPGDLMGVMKYALSQPPYPGRCMLPALTQLHVQANIHGHLAGLILAQSTSACRRRLQCCSSWCERLILPRTP